MKSYQEERLQYALETARCFGITYIDQYGKSHDSKPTRDAIDICRVFRKYRFTNYAVETHTNSLTGIYCDKAGLKKVIEALGLDHREQVILKIQQKYILLFKHPLYEITNNLTLAKNVILLKDDSLIPMKGSKLIGDHNQYYDVELIGDIAETPEFPEELEGFINV